MDAKQDACKPTAKFLAQPHTILLLFFVCQRDTANRVVSTSLPPINLLSPPNGTQHHTPSVSRPYHAGNPVIQTSLTTDSEHNSKSKNNNNSIQLILCRQSSQKQATHSRDTNGVQTTKTATTIRPSGVHLPRQECDTVGTWQFFPCKEAFQRLAQ